MKSFYFLVLFSLTAFASSYESGFAFVCVQRAKYISIESNKGTMDYCKPCTAEMLEGQGRKVGEQEIDQLCHDAVLLYIANQNKNLSKQ